ncbi:hypothetical protein ACR52_27050 [Pseudomonas fildesensis]|uniref:Uncharacterized protein n=1 Tax=Pseudomonas fildesensis TaxID=1674920 RepID=A0A0J8ILA4_9PSED|nr:hypothetical protein ACR52_27050 [Pseudomonas fildesensis]
MDLADEVHPEKSEAVDLLGKIANANTRHQVFSCEGEVLAFMWRLETDDEVSHLDINNLRVVFSMASEKRLHELAVPKG